MQIPKILALQQQQQQQQQQKERDDKICISGGQVLES